MSKKEKATSEDPAQLEAQLALARSAEEVRRADELERLQAESRHSRDRADVATGERLNDLERERQEAAAESGARLARMYAEALEAGTRTRIRSAMARSGEARALTLEQLRGLNYRVLIPALSAFGLWSTAGVRDGGVRLMNVDRGDLGWWALWALEPALIAVVVWIIFVQSRLASAGGELAKGARHIMVGALGTSIALNLIAAVPAPGSRVAGWAVPGAMLGHAIAPVLAAITAHLIGIVNDSISKADPWTERGRPVPLLADMDLTPPADRAGPAGLGPDRSVERTVERNADGVVRTGGTDRARTGTQDGTEPVRTTGTNHDRTGTEPVRTTGTNHDRTGTEPVRTAVWPVPVDGRTTLPIVSRTTAVPAPEPARTAPAEPVRTGVDQPEPAVRTASPNRDVPAAEPVRTTRPNRGVPVPEAVRTTGSRTVSDDELLAELERLIEAGEVEPEPSRRAVRDALQIGDPRAKRVLELREVRSDTDNRVVPLHPVSNTR